MTPGEEHLAFWTKELRHYRAANFVYVIQGDPETPIKVGIARDVRARISGLQTGNPQMLHLLEVLPGDVGLEWSLHRRLRGNRVQGEWFGGALVEPFLGYITGLSEWMLANYRGYGKPPDYRDFDAFLGKRGEVVTRFVEPQPRP